MFKVVCTPLMILANGICSGEHHPAGIGAGLRPVALVAQLTRSAMLDVMLQDYVRTATAKGLTKRTVVMRHALRNALNPIVSAVSGWFAALLTGALLKMSSISRFGRRDSYCLAGL